MSTPTHQDAARREAAEAGLPPDVHDPATLDAYAAFMGQRPATEQAEAEPSKPAAAKRKTR